MRRLSWRPAAVAWLAAVFAVPAGAADLLEIYGLAQAGDPTFESARHSLEAVQQRLPQARAGLLPVVAANGTDNRTWANTTFSNTARLERDVHTWNWSLQLTQPLVRVQNFYAYSEAEAVVEQASAQFAQAEQDLILRVAQAYFDVVVAEESIAVAEAQVKAMGEQLAIAKRGFEAGTSAVTDVHEAKSHLDLARAQRVGARNDLENKRSELEKLVGELPPSLSRLRPSVVAPTPEPNDPQAWVSQAKENHPTVRAQRAALAAAEATVSKNRAEHLPTLDLTASYGGNSASGSLTTPANFSTLARTKAAGVQLSIPLFAGGATSAKVAEALANRSKTQADLEAAKRQAGTDAKQAFAGIANGLAQVEALESAVDSGRSAVTGNQRGYQLGIRINIDVLNAEQQLYTSQRDLAKARYDTLLQGLKLKAAAGVLGEADVATINGLLGGR